MAGIASRIWDSSRHTARTFPYFRFLLAMVIAAAGGWVFWRLGLPLPWMLGPMTACTLAALARAPVAAPGLVRPPFMMVIGVLLGAGFTPAVLQRLPEWLPTLAGLIAFVAASGAACVLYFERVARLDRTTAYFAGMPGGLAEMVLLGEEKGGDPRVIGLVHSARLLIVIFAVSFFAQFWSGVDLSVRPSFGVSILETSWLDEVWLVATALVGAVAGHLLRFPAAYMLGPMLVSAVLHLTGVTHFKPPFELVSLAQLVLGATIGCRFAGTQPAEILRILLVSLGSSAILLGLTLLFAFGVNQVSTFDPLPLVLAYSPGGLTEMSLVALSIGIEVPFVAAHHVFRVLLVMVGAAPVFALVGPAPARLPPAPD